jgi:hypothetical protein
MFSDYPTLDALRPVGSDTCAVTGDRVDFLISHADGDRAWAEWVTWQLTEAGYAVELDVWDWSADQNFVTAISDALDRCARAVALFSAAYFDRSRYTAMEWSAAALRALGMTEGRLVPLRVENIPPEAMPASTQALGETAARAMNAGRRGITRPHMALSGSGTDVLPWTAADGM